MKRLFLWVAAPIVLLLAIILIYFAVAFGSLLFPANTTTSSTQTNTATPTIDAYISSNGVHTDFIFPTRTPQIDWTTIFPVTAFPSPTLGTDFIAIGWGDREFYLNTPRWKDLTLKRAVFALTGQDHSLMHVEYLGQRDFQAITRTQTYHLRLSTDQYIRLRNYVIQSTRIDKNTAQNVPNYHYDQNDAFFAANGQYSALKTCNIWIGNGLQQAGVKVSRWTPLDITVYWYLKPVTSN
ncbi:MAG: TIGR02117 family protein [Gammaproteobacteria bacterium]|nr:TIGR02117 family protein [Gammaproteobacteria bacterium]